MPNTIKVKNSSGDWVQSYIRGLPYTNVYTPVSSLASGTSATGPYSFRQGVSFTNGTRTSVYHIDATAASASTPAPLIIHLHGDGYQEYSNMASSLTSSVAYRYMDVARAQGAIFLLARTPDTSSETWYTAAYATTWLVALINDVKSKYNVDNMRIFYSGFSGGAEQVTYNMMVDHHTLLLGGGAMILGGGGAEGVSFSGTPSDTLKNNFPMQWFVGENDVAGATEPPDWSARADSAIGEAFYRNAGFKTKYTIIPNKAHNDSEPLGPGYLNDVMNESNTYYGLSTKAMPAVPQPPVSVVNSTSTTTLSSTTNKSIAAPTSLAGDLLVMYLSVTGTVSAAGQAALPNGFTSHGSYARPSNNNLRLMIGTRVATGSEGSSFTATIPSGVSFRCDVINMRGADPSKLGVPVFAESPPSLNYAAPSITPTTSQGSLLCSVTNLGGNSWTSPAQMTEITDATMGSPFLGMTVAEQSISSKSATGTKTFVASSGSYSGIVASMFVPTSGTS